MIAHVNAESSCALKLIIVLYCITEFPQKFTLCGKPKHKKVCVRFRESSRSEYPANGFHVTAVKVMVREVTVLSVVVHCGNCWIFIIQWSPNIRDHTENLGLKIKFKPGNKESFRILKDSTFFLRSLIVLIKFLEFFIY